MIPTIAVDAMGGDHAPEEIVAGAVQVHRIMDGRARIVLVGQHDAVAESLERVGSGVQLDIVHAEQIVTMHDTVASLRRKKDSSLAVAIRMQKEGTADAMISAGNTGAAMATSLLQLGRIRGVERPAIAVPMPTMRNSVCTLIDGGANSSCKAGQLYQFAVMGSLYHEQVHEKPRPTVGLLSIGEEASKGDTTVQEANKLLASSSLNFVGNIEGKDILPGEVDVVVSDGFTGNVLLKFAESSVGFIKSMMREAARQSPVTMLSALLMKGALRKAMARFDYEEYGGAPLLGIGGITIICHGRSSAKAIRNAALAAEKEIKGQLNRHIKAELQRTSANADG